MAEALKAHLAYRRSVALADISTAVDNVFVQTPKGYLLSTDSVLVYDNVHGGLGLTEALWLEPGGVCGAVAPGGCHRTQEMGQDLHPP